MATRQPDYPSRLIDRRDRRRFGRHGREAGRIGIPDTDKTLAAPVVAELEAQVAAGVQRARLRLIDELTALRAEQAGIEQEVSRLAAMSHRDVTAGMSSENLQRLRARTIAQAAGADAAQVAIAARATGALGGFRCQCRALEADAQALATAWWTKNLEARRNRGASLPDIDDVRLPSLPQGWDDDLPNLR